MSHAQQPTFCNAKIIVCLLTCWQHTQFAALSRIFCIIAYFVNSVQKFNIIFSKFPFFLNGLTTPRKSKPDYSKTFTNNFLIDWCTLIELLPDKNTNDQAPMTSLSLCEYVHSFSYSDVQTAACHVLTVISSFLFSFWAVRSCANSFQVCWWPHTVGNRKLWHKYLMSTNM